MADRDLERTVAVIGGGIAGITAAVKLYRQGYKVTLIEKAAVLGGNLSSGSMDDRNRPRDVYPHIFGDWYKEFWYLLEEDLSVLGLKREDVFLRRDRIKMARIPADPKAKIRSFKDVDYAELATATSLANMLTDLNSKVLSKTDMFLFGYTYLDMVSTPQPRRPQKVLNELDVTGYLYSRPYMNNAIAEFHDDILKVIWSMPSDQTSAQAYQNLIRHTLTFPNETPFAWLARGPLGDILMEPIAGALKRALADGGALMLGTEVTGLALGDKAGDAATLTLRADGETSAPRKFQYVVVAVPPKDALKLAFSPLERGMITRAPQLASLRQAQTGRIPVVYLRFNKAFLDAHRTELSLLPATMTGFQQAPGRAEARKAERADPGDAAGSIDYDITIVNLAAIWPHRRLETAAPEDPVLVLAASRADTIPAPGPGERHGADGRLQGFAMILKLCEYWPFIRAGSRWGDPAASDIDWETTCVITNDEHQLFLNNAGSDEWRPLAVTPGLENVFFAGDYCMTDVDMATVEAAVQSGVLAARALQAKAGYGAPIGLQAHDIYATGPLLLTRLMLTPLAFGAALAASFDEARDDPLGALTLPVSAAVLGTAYGVDWLKGAVDFWGGFLPGREVSPSGGAAKGNVAAHDHRIGLVGLGCNIAYALATQGPAVLKEVLGKGERAPGVVGYAASGAATAAASCLQALARRARAAVSASPARRAFKPDFVEAIRANAQARSRKGTSFRDSDTVRDL
jgi:uncharacterized protein with NAD-binding domain and iron-sulfur cluster